METELVKRVASMILPINSLATLEKLRLQVQRAQETQMPLDHCRLMGPHCRVSYRLPHGAEDPDVDGPRFQELQHRFVITIPLGRTRSPIVGSPLALTRSPNVFVGSILAQTRSRTISFGRTRNPIVFVGSPLPLTRSHLRRLGPS